MSWKIIAVLIVGYVAGVGISLSFNYLGYLDLLDMSLFEVSYYLITGIYPWGIAPTLFLGIAVALIGALLRRDFKD